MKREAFAIWAAPSARDLKPLPVPVPETEN